MLRARGPRAGNLLGPLPVFAALVLYWPVLGHEFTNWDDDLYVTANETVRAGLTAGGAAWAFTTAHAANWHPLTWLSHMADVSLFGLDPAGHHLTNLLLHALNAWLLFVVLDRLTDRPGRSAFVAALFALHPLHVEPVAWIAERKELLATTFLFLTLLCWKRWVASPGPARYLAGLLALACGLGSKPTLVSVPFLLLLLDFWPLRRVGKVAPRRLLAEKLPLFALALASSWITLAVQSAGGATGGFERYPLTVRLAQAARAAVGYLYRTVWPTDLAVFYPHPGAAAVGAAAAVSAVLLLLAGVAAFRLRTGRPYLLTGWLWYLVALAPMVGIVQVGEQGMADRYTYVPLIGVFVAATWWAADKLRARRRLAVSLGVALPLILAVVSHGQLSVWRDSVTLFRHAVRATGDNPTAQLNLAMALAERGDDADALDHYREALRLRPGLPKIHNNLAVSLERTGRDEQALEHYERALRIDPGYVDALNNRGKLLAARGRPAQALESFRAAIRVEPGSALAHYNAGTLLARMERWPEAVTHLQRAVELRPRDAAARYNLALALYFGGDRERAAAERMRAEELGYEIPDGSPLR